uniref:Reverse transcriptase/retrotransposon-derived protein RNase H-like domain-containing protein n=1 Tax=Salvator merianae TaxID=96440 RepID=A0A8D0C9J0_SALMN
RTPWSCSKRWRLGDTRYKTPELLPWTEEHETSFRALKQALATAPALGLPDYKKTFTLYCHEKGGIAQGVLTQKHGDAQRPVAYYSTALDPVAVGLPSCQRAVAAAATLVEASAPLIMAMGPVIC